MIDDKLGNAGGVVAGMLRSLESGDSHSAPPTASDSGETTALIDADCENEVLEINCDFNYDGYQVVRREFFAHINEPSVTFNNYKFYVNTACLNRFQQVDYVQVLVNQENRILAIRPCRAEDRDACAWCTSGSGRRKPKQITCKIFFAKVFSLMGWNLDYRYKLLGRVIHAKEEWLIVFDLTATEVYQRVQKDGQKPRSSRTPVFPEGWKTQFGLPFREHQKAMHVDIFEGYAVYGLRDNIAEHTSNQPEEMDSGNETIQSALGGREHEQ